MLDKIIKIYFNYDLLGVSQAVPAGTFFFKGV